MNNIIGQLGVLSVAGELYHVIPTNEEMRFNVSGEHTILCRVLAKTDDVPVASLSLGDYTFNQYKDGYLSLTKRGPETMSRASLIEKVIFNDPATIVYWSDGSKTVVKCQPGDAFSEELGLAMAISKKFLGNKGNFNDVFKSFLPNLPKLGVEKMRDRLSKFCDDRMCCQGCKLEGPVCRCGRGGSFDSEKDEKSYMTDDEIREAYKIVFGKKG